MSTIQQCCITIVVDILGRSEKRLRQDQKRGGTLDLNVMYMCHSDSDREVIMKHATVTGQNQLWSK